MWFSTLACFGRRLVLRMSTEYTVDDLGRWCEGEGRYCTLTLLTVCVFHL